MRVSISKIFILSSSRLFYHPPHPSIIFAAVSQCRYVMWGPVFSTCARHHRGNTATWWPLSPAPRMPCPFVAGIATHLDLSSNPTECPLQCEDNTLDGWRTPRLSGQHGRKTKTTTWTESNNTENLHPALDGGHPDNLGNMDAKPKQQHGHTSTTLKICTPC